MSGTPGLHPEQLLAQLDNATATRLLPPGSLELIDSLKPELLENSNRPKTLGRLISLELAVDDPNKRSVIIDNIPTNKLKELEKRLGCCTDSLRTANKLNPRIRSLFLGFLGRPVVPQWTNQNDSVDEEIIKASYGLFAHQKRAASLIEKHLYFGSGRAMLHLPTGTGKTRTAMSIVASHLRRRPNGLVVWLATTGELLEQAAVEFHHTWSCIGDRPINCLRFWSQHNPSIEQVTDGIIIAGLAKLHHYGRSRKSLWHLGDRTSFVVFDEAHQAVALTYSAVAETLVTRNPKTPFLGLSATPGRTWRDPEIDSTVSDMFHRNKVTLEFGDNNPIRKLTDNGYLAKVEFSFMNFDPGTVITSKDLSDIANSFDIPSHIAIKLGSDIKRNLRIIQRIIELSKRHSRIVMFAPSVENAILIASICRAIGIEADTIISKTNSLERKYILERFKQPGVQPRVLINYGILTTGFDAPSASAALIARPTRSLVLYSQMVGRVIRGPLAGGTKECEVVTVVDTTLPGFSDVAEAFMNWEDVWTQ